MKIAVVGVTGLVGSVMLKVLEEFKFPVSELLAVASEKSKGKKVEFCKQFIEVINIEEALKEQPQMTIFSAGGQISKIWAPKFADIGCYVIDNSSAWRMDSNVPLVVPEINGNTIKKDSFIIANPNCSTIQLLLAVSPLHQVYGLKKMVVATYQSVSGTGIKAVQQLFDERNDKPVDRAYPHPIDLNCFPHGGEFLDNAYTSEEMKLVNESHKILNNCDIQIEATVVRIPVIGGHSEAVYMEFEKEITVDKVKELLGKQNGIIIQDDILKNLYPMPICAHNKNEVFVGRIRKSLFNEKALNFWVVADNLRKGAATNAIQIAQLIYDKYLKQN